MGLPNTPSNSIARSIPTPTRKRFTTWPPNPLLTVIYISIPLKPVILGVLDGFNGTIFAYGQTSSGKTHTMQGPDIEDLEMQGIIPRMVRTVFARIETAGEHIEFTVKISMIEIYKEKIRDLLDPTKDNL